MGVFDLVLYYIVGDVLNFWTQRSLHIESLGQNHVLYMYNDDIQTTVN